MLGGDPPLLSFKQPCQTSLHRRGSGRTFFPVRWKLLIITSLVAALLGAGGIHALNYLMEGWRQPLSAQPGLAAGIIGIPLLFVTLAAIFVYRHTARRRKLQAALTALFALVLTIAAFLIVARILPERPTEVRLFPILSPHDPA
jgi:hypothetical protein